MQPISDQSYTENSHFTNPIAANVQWLGYKINYLPRIVLTELFKVFRNLKPGFQDQCENRFKEVCMRMGRALLCLAATWTIALGIIGISLQLAASRSQRTFTYIHPNTLPKNPQAGRINQLSVATFNVAQMPEPVNVINGLRPGSERRVTLADELLKRDDDIVCLQEVFNSETSDYLIERLREKYPYIICNAGPRVLGIGSGLMILSKYPIKHAHYWRHLARNGTEQFANKGTLAVTVQPNPEQEFVIFNSHLHANEGDVDQCSINRRLQLRQLADNVDSYLDRHYQHSNITPAVLMCGDFNIQPLRPAENGERDELEQDPEWLALKCVMDPLVSDHDRTLTVYDLESDRNAGWQMEKVRKWKRKQEYVDHIGIPKVTNPILHVTQSRRFIDHMGGCSDHLAVRTVMQLTP